MFTMSIPDLFTQHPASVGESYGQHFRAALGFAVKMFVGALACLVHAFLPFLFVKTGSGIIDGLHDRMVVNRNSVTMPNSLAGPSRSDGRRAA